MKKIIIAIMSLTLGFMIVSCNQAKNTKTDSNGEIGVMATYFGEGEFWLTDEHGKKGNGYDFKNVKLNINGNNYDLSCDVYDKNTGNPLEGEYAKRKESGTWKIEGTNFITTDKGSIGNSRTRTYSFSKNDNKIILEEQKGSHPATIFLPVFKLKHISGKTIF